MSRHPHRPLPVRIRAELFAQLAQMENAGLPFDRALSVLRLPKPFQARIDILQPLIAKGAELASAGEKCGLFTKLESRLIEAATNAGSPETTYRRLASYYTDRARQLATMKARLMLPAALFLLALIIQPIPALVTGSLSTAGYVWQVLKPLLLIAGLIAGIRALARAEARGSGKSLFQHLPVYGPIFVRQNLRDVFESLGLMLEAGLPMSDAVTVALDTAQDGDIRRELSKIRPRVANGASLAEALQGVGYVKDERLTQFIHTGEASGKLPEMLLRHTRMETESIDSALEQLATWVPRVVYGVALLWMAYGLLTGGGLMPTLL
jgi:type II secretory pathway component PulF